MLQSSSNLLLEMTQVTERVLAEARKMNELDLQTLQTRKSPEAWNALECIEHLNLYARFYHPEISLRMQKANRSTDDEDFKSTWLGNYFANTMKATETLKPMKTFASMNPLKQNLSNSHLNEFIAHQEKLLELLKQAKLFNLNKVKTGISISRFIKLRLGDTFKVVIYHNERHLLQAKRAIESV